MTPREKLQYSYELAFYPPRLHDAWDQIKRGRMADREALGELLDTALLLHGALPERGYASQRALNRMALYQAKARAFGMVSFLSLERAVARQRIVQLIHSHRFTEKPRRTLRVRLRFFANR
jgi:hypothetical protein